MVLLDNAADGQTLRVRKQAWEDPFAEPLSAGNRAFVEKSGKWTAFDVSAEGSFAAFIGDVLGSVEPVAAEDGAVTGVVLRTRSGGVIRVDAEADELFVSQLIPARRIEERQLRQ